MSSSSASASTTRSALRVASRELIDLGYRRIVLLLVSLIVVPTALLLALGVILLFIGSAEANVLMGILVLALSGATITGVILVWVFVRREAHVSRLQSDFTSKVSHELRTPLTSIRLFTETLKLRQNDPETQKQCLDAIDRESQRLQELIDRLLDWGKMESGKRQYQMVTTDLRSIVENTLAAFETLRHRKDVQLDVQLPPDNYKIFGDPGALGDSLLNLLINAAKYGKPPRKIAVHCAESAKHYYLTVKDNGIGIPLSEHSRIFQKFYRVDDRLSREQEGSGLGLTIVYHVMKAHQGRVELTSRPGHGSTFSLVLPRTEPDS